MAVLDLLAQSGIDAVVVAPVTEALMEELVGSRDYVVLGRGYIEQVLKEKEFQLSGMVTDAQAAVAGQYLGADYVVAGKIRLLDTTYIVVAKLIDVRTGVILAQSSESGEGRVAMRSAWPTPWARSSPARDLPQFLPPPSRRPPRRPRLPPRPPSRLNPRPSLRSRIASPPPR